MCPYVNKTYQLQASFISDHHKHFSVQFQIKYLFQTNFLVVCVFLTILD